MTGSSLLSHTYPTTYRVLVIGGGHAGCEAALATARCGFETLLLTQNVDRIGWMSCNPAIGGVGKSHLVAEIDALGGEMARNADRAGVHYKLLNGSRGPAVRAVRVQCDKLAYATAMRGVLEAQPGLAIKQADVRRLWLDDGRLRGVETTQGLRFSADIVILTAGTFLAAVCHTGLQQQTGGRAGDAAAWGLGEQLRSLGVQTLRHKTGTCPRVDGRTVDWPRLLVDPGLEAPPPLSRHGAPPPLPQMPCHQTWTSSATHEIIRANLGRSPLYTGLIAGTGPRYCPSVEDKVVRFADHPRHPLFLEREGWQTQEIYINGLSTSLPADVQVAMVRSIDGLEHAEIVRFGYAVEYDAIDARQLDTDLQLRALPGLYFAGQVNGTSGYEEAAGQGLVAGLSAVARLRGQPPLELTRQTSYLGVMVDDLVTHGADEPYRMFTSRAEHRLTLRTSNADQRLTPAGRASGLVGDEQWAKFQTRTARLERARTVLQDTIIRPTRETRDWLAPFGSGDLVSPATLAMLLCRKELAWPALEPWLPASLQADGELDEDDREELQTEVRYAGYVEREAIRHARARRQEQVQLPAALDYAAIGALSREAVQALVRVRPQTLAQAARIPGVTSAALQALSFHLTALRRRSIGSSNPDVAGA